MLPLEQDLERRRPVWEALADLFLDTMLDEDDYRRIAKRIVVSGYTPTEVRSIFWDEVFPAAECNIRHPAGECYGFDADWLQERILRPGRGMTVVERLVSAIPIFGTASVARKAWAELLRFLPDNFRDEA